MNYNITNKIEYIGVNDKTLDLFESQYIVPNGISYNSYLIKDEKIVVMDTVDKRKKEEWLNNLEEELNGKEVDYLVISHLEPDHSSSIKELTQKYPNMKLVGNNLTFKMLIYLTIPMAFGISFLSEPILTIIVSQPIFNISFQSITSTSIPLEKKLPPPSPVVEKDITLPSLTSISMSVIKPIFFPFFTLIISLSIISDTLIIL